MQIQRYPALSCGSQVLHFPFQVAWTRLFAYSLCADLHVSQERLHKKNQDLVSLYREKCARVNKIITSYNALRSRNMKSQVKSALSGTTSQALDSLPRNVSSLLAQPLTTSASNVNLDPHNRSRISPGTPSARRREAHPVNLEGVEQLHRYQRSGTGSSRGVKRTLDAATTVMPPPVPPMANPRPRKRYRIPV